MISLRFSHFISHCLSYKHQCPSVVLVSLKVHINSKSTEQWLSNCGPWMSNISVTGVLARNANSQVPASTEFPGDRSSNLCSNKPYVFGNHSRVLGFSLLTLHSMISTETRNSVLCTMGNCNADLNSLFLPYIHALYRENMEFFLLKMHSPTS